MLSTKVVKSIPLAAAISAALFANMALAAEKADDTQENKTTEDVISEVVANPTDLLTDGWSVNGYVRTGWRLTENGTSTDNEFGKPDYRTAGTSAKSANQVEFTITKKTEFYNGVWSDLVIRSEYGNGDSHMYSSSGSEEGANEEGGFEVKEAFMKLGGMDYLPEDAHIWAGRRFLNRSAGLISGEFWKQSSGVGFGYEQGKSGVAVVSVDSDNEENLKVNDDDAPIRATMTSLDFYSYGHEGLGGSFDFDLKIMTQGNKSDLENYYQNDTNDDGELTPYNDDVATSGVGAAITYNRDWYGLDGWSQTGLAYGKGMAANRGVNYGSWSGQTGSGAATNADAETVFLTSYGVLNINDKWQLGSEVTYLYGKNIWGLYGDQEVQRLLVAARPTYRVNDNFRWEFTGAFGPEKSHWTNNEVENAYTAEIAGVFTVNADYFGRPQIKPFVSYFHKDNGWGSEFGNDKGVFQVGVEGEIWF